MKSIKHYFDPPLPFTTETIKSLEGIVGLYLIFLSQTEIRYPFNSSRLLYIGMSEAATNSIGKRLNNHYSGKSGNLGLVNYRKIEPLLITHINFQMLKEYWKHPIQDLESYFILDFVKHYGVYPICNNKSGYNILENDLSIELDIQWSYFQAGSGPTVNTTTGEPTND